MHTLPSSAVLRLRWLFCAMFCLSPLLPAKEAPKHSVLTGIEVLEKMKFRLLQGKRVGLITNHTGQTHDGRRTIDLLAHAPGVELKAIFSPEHGPGGIREGDVEASGDAATGLPIFSLYGKTRRPTDEMLKDLDVLVFDIQDAGARFYTYITTMGYAMEEAAKRNIGFMVLDRPNPLTGSVEGPMLDPDKLSFVGYYPMPIRHGMTVGELATMFNQEKQMALNLEVIWMQGWRPTFWFDDTDLKWIPPSPNLKTFAGALVYPGIELLRAGGVSVGRGTDTPFEQFGAPWVNSDELLRHMKRRKIPGVRFSPVRFTPQADIYAGQLCYGLRVQYTTRDRSLVLPVTLGVELLAALHKLYPRQFQLEQTIRLLGSAETLEGIKRGDDPRNIVSAWAGAWLFWRQTEPYRYYLKRATSPAPEPVER